MLDLNKSLKSNSMPKFICLPTKGQGDCALHAILGKWNGQEIACENIANVREQLKTTLQQKPINPNIKKLLCSAITELVMSGNNLNKFPVIRKLREKYQKFIVDGEILTPQSWQVFEEELNKYSDIIQYINDNHFLKKGPREYNSLRNQFYAALSQNEDRLYDLLANEPALAHAFQTYNMLNNIAFDWENSISTQVIEEYALFISTPNKWLLPSELQIVAHVFHRKVIYYSRFGARPDIFNSEGIDGVSVQFNGVNHYQQMGIIGQYKNLVPKFSSSEFPTPYAEKQPLTKSSLLQSSTLPVIKSFSVNKDNSKISQNVTFNQQASGGNALATVGAVIATLPSTDHPNTYNMSHLLPAGAKGTDYQLLVFLERLVRLMIEEKNFEADVESMGAGNLDDICIIIKDPKGKHVVGIEAYQVKCYNDPIPVYDFLKKEKKSKSSKENNKTEKMHIGKFFDGWLSLTKKYPELTSENLHCILHTNTSIDSNLAQAIRKNKFKKDFIESKNIAFIPWPNEKSLNKVNLFDFLFNQSFDYLSHKALHGDVVKQNEKNRKQVFKNFLNFLHFRINQPDIDLVTKSIQENLSLLLNNPSGQIFLCLYYAIHEWFLRGYLSPPASKITPQVMKELLEESMIRSHDVLLLQGRSEATKAHLSYTCEGIYLLRDEITEEFNLAIKSPGQVVGVTGEKGIGKSGLVKQALAKCDDATYVFLSAADLVQEIKLRNTLLQVLIRIEGIKIIVIDSAELLFILPEEELKEFLVALKNSNRVLVLTMTSETFQHPIFRKLNTLEIPIKPLSASQIEKYFPELQPYQSIEPLMQLACIPFYLTIIIRLIKQTATQNFRDMVESNVGLNSQLMEWLVHGQRVNEVPARRLVWQQLSVKIASISNGLSLQFELSPALAGVRLLLADGILTETKGKYRFSHDLFFEYGLISFLSQKWQTAFAEGTTETFWLHASNQLKMNDSTKIFEKWFLSYKSQLMHDWILHIDVLSKMSYFKLLIGVAILTNDTNLLNLCLKEHPVLLNNLLVNFFSQFSTTYISFAIQCNAAESLQLLLQYGAKPHHPLAGKLEIIHYQSYTTAKYKNNKNNKNNKNSIAHDDSDESTKDYDSDEEQSNASEDTNSDATEESEEGYSYGYRSSNDSEASDNHWNYSHSDEALITAPEDQFVSHPKKYWFAGFNETPGEFDDEGEWYENPNYQQAPCYDRYYIHQAVISDRAACLTHLIEAYKKCKEASVIQLFNECQETPLHLGVLHKAYSCVELLCEEIDNVDYIDMWGESALHNATYIGDLKFIKLLLENGANPSLLNKMEMSPFHIALTHFDIEMIEVFLEHEADLSLKPFQRFKNDEMVVADLLEKMATEYHQETEMEEFVIKLIGLLNYGEDEETEDQVEELMTLIEHRAALLKHWPGFAYTDEESQLEYALDYSFEIDDLTDYILDDSERIAMVLESQTFSPMKAELFEEWLGCANTKQYKNLKQYAEEVKDKELLDLIGLSDEEGDDVQCNALTDSSSHYEPGSSVLFKPSLVTTESQKPSSSSRVT